MIEILVGCSQNCKLPSLKFHLYTYLYTVSVMGDSMIYSSSLRATCCITKKQLSIVSFTSIYTKVPLQVRPLEVGISANCYTMCCRISVHVCMYIWFPMYEFAWYITLFHNALYMYVYTYNILLHWMLYIRRCSSKWHCGFWLWLFWQVRKISLQQWVNLY